MCGEERFITIFCTYRTLHFSQAFYSFHYTESHSPPVRGPKRSFPVAPSEIWAEMSRLLELSRSKLPQLPCVGVTVLPCIRKEGVCGRDLPAPPTPPQQLSGASQKLAHGPLEGKMLSPNWRSRSPLFLFHNITIRG